jgi:uncharacterized membrane protein YgcG
MLSRLQLLVTTIPASLRPAPAPVCAALPLLPCPSLLLPLLQAQAPAPPRCLPAVRAAAWAAGGRLPLQGASTRAPRLQTGQGLGLRVVEAVFLRCFAGNVSGPVVVGAINTGKQASQQADGGGGGGGGVGGAHPWRWGLRWHAPPPSLGCLSEGGGRAGGGGGGKGLFGS